jgi:hypothetical protein
VHGRAIHFQLQLLVGEFLQHLLDHFHSFFGNNLRFRGTGVAGQALAYIVGVDRSSRRVPPETKLPALGVVADQIESDTHQPRGAAIAAELSRVRCALRDNNPE